MYCAALTGVDVYQLTAPSRLAAASSTGSGVNSCAKADPPNRMIAIRAGQIAARMMFLPGASRPTPCVQRFALGSWRITLGAPAPFATGILAVIRRIGKPIVGAER